MVIVLESRQKRSGSFKSLSWLRHLRPYAVRRTLLSVKVNIHNYGGQDRFHVGTRNILRLGLQRAGICQSRKQEGILKKGSQVSVSPQTECTDAKGAGKICETLLTPAEKSEQIVLKVLGNKDKKRMIGRKLVCGQPVSLGAMSICHQQDISSEGFVMIPSIASSDRSWSVVLGFGVFYFAGFCRSGSKLGLIDCSMMKDEIDCW